MAIATPLLTYEQYMAEPEDMRRYEILDGVRTYRTNPPIRHQDILMNIATRLHTYGRESGHGMAILSPCDILIRRQPLRTRQPDVLFISYARLDNKDLTDPAPLEVAPELVVEILSPSDTSRILAGKLTDYSRVGVQECWAVHPGAQTVEVLRLTPEGAQTVAIYNSDQTLSSVALPNLTLPVADIFAP